MDTEVWKDIPNSGGYQVSSYGRIRKITYPALSKTADGYHKIWFAGKPHLVHQLVCRAFHGDSPKDKPLALHRDDDRDNNSADNLYWGNHADNAADRVRNGNVRPLTDEQIRMIRNLPSKGRGRPRKGEEHKTLVHVAKELGLTIQHLHSIRRGEIYKDVK